MQPNFLDHDRAKYEELAGLPEYQDFSPGELYAPIFVELVGVEKGATVLDAGCCTGKGGLALAALGFTVTLCDYTPDLLIDAAKALPFHTVCLWNLHEVQEATKRLSHWNSSKADYVFCADVLEHLPKEFTMLAVYNLLSVAKRGVFFTISLTPDIYGVWIGRPLHETIESFTWWRDRLAQFGTVVDARDLVSTGIFYVRPR